MHFLPNTEKNYYKEFAVVLNELESKKTDALLHFMQEFEADGIILDGLFSQILQGKESYNWLLSDPQFVEALQNLSADGPFLILIKNHLAFHKKFKEINFTSRPFYVRAQKCLWKLFFKDLEVLKVSTSSHHYVNLKNYLEWSQHQKTLENAEMISKILFPFYKALKDDSKAPFSFLFETLKLVLFLNPNHLAGTMEFVRILEVFGRAPLALDYLNRRYKDGCQDREILSKLALLLFKSGDHKRLELFCAHLFARSIANLDARFYCELSSHLYQIGEIEASLFYALKAFSFRKDNPMAVHALKRSLYALDEFDLAEAIKEFWSEEDGASRVLIYLDSDLNPTDFRFKLSSMDPWITLDGYCLELPRSKRSRIEVSCIKAREDQIFYPHGKGPFRLSLEEDQLEIYKLERVKPAMDATYEYQGFKLGNSVENLRDLTPFHFARSERAE